MASATPTSSEVDAIIDEMVRRIVERFDPEQVILFGSRARGDARPDSDVDLLIVMPVEGSRLDWIAEIHGTLADIGMAKDVVLATPDEMERRKQIVGTMARVAEQQGKLLYERAP